MGTRGLLITIDGPAGAGKSTVAKLLAKRLGYLYLDTGAMYRAVALAAKRAGLSLDDHRALGELCRTLSLELVPSEDGVRVFLDGEEVTEALRTPEIDRLSSIVAQVPAVRACLKERQRVLGARGAVVAEGRDMGSHVFPEADYKFFLTARAEERAKRRLRDLHQRGHRISFEEVLEEIRRRDERDQAREIAPLIIPEGAEVIDTTYLDHEEVVERILLRLQRVSG